MAQVSFDDAQELINSRGNGNNIGFFNLVNDGDEAIVRIMHDSTADFNIFTTHSINLDGKYRKINCIRDPREPVDMCPLCRQNIKSQNRIFINMLQYFKEEDGSIVAEPVVWERSMAYATKLKNLIDEYGPLSDCIFKIKRNGAKGSMDTTYDIFYCNPKIFRDDLYEKVEGAFKDQRILGTIVLDKNVDEITTFLQTGKFPQTSNSGNNDAASMSANYVPKNSANIDVIVDDSEVPFDTTPSAPPRRHSEATESAGMPPARNNSGAPGRPTRYY